MENNLLGVDIRRTWKLGDIDVLKGGGVQWSIFISKDSHLLLVHVNDSRFSLLLKKLLSSLMDEGEVHEKGVKFLEIEECENFEDGAKDLSLNEFVNSHNLKKYLEDKMDRKMRIFLLQSING